MKTMTRKKHKRKNQNATPYFFFTPEMVTVAQKAMHTFELALGRTTRSAARVEFAAETMQQVNVKLETMQTAIGSAYLTAFDYNEKIVLATAIQMYILDLLTGPSNASRQKELQQCQQIERFALDHLATGQERTLHD